jgi:5-methylcytosine-specific restriction endonuclease McrA
MLNPICQHCEARGITKEYDIGEDGKTLKLIVDHVIPVHVRPDLRLVLENTQTLCRACHKVKTDNDVLIYGAAE